MSLRDLQESCLAKAIMDKLDPDELSDYKFICRQYSKAFHTPLHVVENDLDPADVISAYYSDVYDGIDLDEKGEEVLDTIYELQDPNYAKEKREELKEFMRQAEAEERARIKAGKPIHPSMKRDQEVTLQGTPDMDEEVKLPDNMPTGGSIDLSRFNLDREE